ncbi:MAG: 2-hydroxyacid dehydrogenase [Chloroflexota bacterium]
MSVGKKIVFMDVTTPAVRKVLLDHLPAGFELVFAEASTEEKAVAAVADADFIFAWATYMPAKVIEAASKAKLIQKAGEGTDRIDVAAAARKGILVAKTTGSNSASVAELATLLILATLRWLPNAHNSMVAGQWLKFQLRPGSFELRRKQVGIVGLGKIGRMVAKQVQGFDASVAYYDAFRLPETEEARLGVTYMPLDDLMRSSDVVTLHVPLMPSTRGLIGRRELGLMKPTAILVNSCRGAVLDEEALYEALKERRIRGAGIDVFTKEPPDANHPLFALDNVVVTPHYGGGTEDAELEGVKHAFANIVKVSRGEPLDPADIASVPKSA